MFLCALFGPSQGIGHMITLLQQYILLNLPSLVQHSGWAFIMLCLSAAYHHPCNRPASFNGLLDLIWRRTQPQHVDQPTVGCGTQDEASKSTACRGVIPACVHDRLALPAFHMKLPSQMSLFRNKTKYQCLVYIDHADEIMWTYLKSDTL